MAKVKINLIKDEFDITQSIEYDFVGLIPNKTIGIYVGDVLLSQIIIDNEGNSKGIIDTIDKYFHTHLMALGGFSATIKENLETGLIASQQVVVEDTDNDNLPDIGTHRLELRYI